MCIRDSSLPYVASPAQTGDTSSVLGWGVLAFMAEHAGSREVNEARRPRTCSRPCAFEEKKSRQKKSRKNPPHRKHTTKATAARRPPPASRRHVMKHVPRVRPHSPASIDPGFCGNRPRTALAISKNDECHTYTDRQTDRQIN